MRPAQEVQLAKEEDAAVAAMSVRGHEGPEGGERHLGREWCLSVREQGDRQHTEVLGLVLDSGSAIHVCPPSVAPWQRVTPGRTLEILSA